MPGPWSGAPGSTRANGSVPTVVAGSLAGRGGWGIIWMPRASHKVAARIGAGHCGQPADMTGPYPQEMGMAMMKDGTPDNSNS